MIVTEGNAATSNIESRQAFTIKASAKAFKLLSSNLYSDKPLAIVREIGCNAIDSHFMAGKPDVPFKVVLPSDMHPWFEVIDYGTGLNDDQVKNVFTTYFESTKTESNDQIGAMGLGSKSPFAYTDAFEVFARQDGVQNQYTCFLNQSGAPELFLIEQKVDPTFENGVTIKVPVKKNDYHLFRNAALKAYKFFPIRPIVGANTVNWNWDEPVYGFEGTNFKTITNDRTIYALMGPVAYPIDTNQLKGEAAFLTGYTNKTGRGFVINYPIGMLDVNAGREGLSYDKTTISNLITGMEKIRSEMAKDLQDEMDKAPNLYQAIILNSKKDPQGIFKLQYNGAGLNTIIGYSFKNPDGTEKFSVREKHRSWIEKLSTLRADSIKVTPANGTRFILIDDKKSYLKKIRYASENIMNALFLMAPDSTTPASKDLFKEVIAKFDEHGTPWSYISDMPTNLPERLKAEKDPNAAKREKVTYSGFYHFMQPFTKPIAVKDYRNMNDGELEGDYLYLKWGSVSKRLTINGYDFRADELSTAAWKMITDAAAKAGKPLAIVTDKVFDVIPAHWADISTLLKAEIRQCMTKQSFEGIYGKWVMTGVELAQVNYDAAMANPKVNTLLKDFFEPLRKIKFGQPLDYMTEQFIKNTFSMSGDNTMGDDGLLKFKDSFTDHILIDKASDRYYGAHWPTKDFSESLVMFSAMIAHGMINETELRGFLK
jgi:hypothetical protein